MPSVPVIIEAPRYLRNAILASLCLHAIIVILCFISLTSNRVPKTEDIFSVELVPDQSPQKAAVQKQNPTQIVAPPKPSSEVAPEQIKIFESEQDNASIKNQIRRGDDGASLQKKIEPILQRQSVVAQKEKASPEQSKAKDITKEAEQPKLVEKTDISHLKLKLKLDSNSLAELSADGSKAKELTTQERLQQAIQASPSENQRSAINVSRLGSRDYLPDIPDGEVTLLNTKANKYAVFVRRVASQVFSNLRGVGWSSLSAADIRAMSQDGVVEAVLSPRGVLLSVKLRSSSESGRFDQVLQTAVQKGAKDPNPPAGAEAEDGNVHFIFQARSWVQMQPNSRNGGMHERRWLMLGTGLE